MDYSEKINDLFLHQLEHWELAKINYELLGKVMTMYFPFGTYEILVQFNPERIRSTSASVDKKSIDDRPCFLCRTNRPPEQQDLPFNEKYTILVNPFPIFERHLTIPANQHIPQRILENFGDLLDISLALPGFSVFYNGPQCGASAPDHLHFQAGSRGFMPVEKDFWDSGNVIIYGRKLKTEIWNWENYHRGIITIRGRSREGLSEAFNFFYNKIAAIQPGRPEPMLNIIAYREKGDWIIHIIPRRLHRPSQYFLEGSGQIVLSPASVDISGVLITPREQDFQKITEDDITDILHQVCFDEAELAGLIREYL